MSEGWRKGSLDITGKVHPFLTLWADLPGEAREKFITAATHDVKVLQVLGFDVQLVANPQAPRSMLPAPAQQAGHVGKFRGAPIIIGQVDSTVSEPPPTTASAASGMSTPGHRMSFLSSRLLHTMRRKEGVPTPPLSAQGSLGSQISEQISSSDTAVAEKTPKQVKTNAFASLVDLRLRLGRWEAAVQMAGTSQKEEHASTDSDTLATELSQPLNDLASIMLDAVMRSAVQSLALNMHSEWAAEKFALGVVYGKDSSTGISFDDRLLHCVDEAGGQKARRRSMTASTRRVGGTHPHLVPFHFLPGTIVRAVGVIKVLVFGYCDNSVRENELALPQAWNAADMSIWSDSCVASPVLFAHAYTLF